MRIRDAPPYTRQHFVRGTICPVVPTVEISRDAHRPSRCCAGGHAHIVDYLTQSCCSKVGELDFAGDSPLHDAARFGHVEIVRSLLRVGADCSLINHEGYTPLMLADLHDKTEVSDVLTRHMASELAAAAAARRKSHLLAGQQVPLAPLKT